jgi:transposase
MEMTRGFSAAWPDALAADKGYSYPRIRAWLAEHRIADVIAMRSDQQQRQPARSFDRQRYKQRNVVERCIGWLKQSRRVCTRFEKLASSFLALVKMAMIVRYLRLGGSGA